MLPASSTFGDCSEGNSNQYCSLSVTVYCYINQDFLSPHRVTDGYCQRCFGMLIRVGLKLIVTGMGAAVGLNGGFVHTVQLGANCLPGAECQAWNEINAAITAE